MNPQGIRDQIRQHSYHSSHDYSTGQAPGINVQHSTPQGPHYTSPPSSGVPLPGVLQPGRPGAGSSTALPNTAPTMPQLQTSGQQHSSRPTTANHTHSYSRSSPTGTEQQKYAPFAGTPESSKFATPSNHRYTSSQHNLGDSTFSPLGLADIRAFNDLDGPQSANPFTSDGIPTFPTNSSYNAPFAIYAFDWCKWPVQQQNLGDSAGKMALGSYVEDGHNFVGCIHALVRFVSDLSKSFAPRYKF